MFAKSVKGLAEGIEAEEGDFDIGKIGDSE